VTKKFREYSNEWRDSGSVLGACVTALSILRSFHLDSPYNREGQLPRPASPPAFPLRSRAADEHVPLMKRAVDLTGSLIALVLLSPLFLGVALAIKLTSKGPVFFRQKRVGQYGVPFVFLKFRSMYVNNDASVHKAYVKQLIAGSAQCHPGNGDGNGVYKLTKDSRVTRIGGFLRRTSLDELPQFINVLRGEMSLAGPRPAIAYEVEAYDIWHRRRVLEAKPGITGLWQVNGRSRIKFDDMVRLDLRYAKSWSPWSVLPQEQGKQGRSFVPAPKKRKQDEERES
jgi:lipopolysaccharide/colanic/teichoic acid biosynthesis glycosyltransferase